jgi:protein-disulfide isomerase
VAQAARRAASGPKTFYWILGGIAVVGVVAIAFATMRGRTEAATEPVDLGQITDARELLARAQGFSVGNEAAPITILVFSDFQCPACKHWALNVERPLKADLVESGQARIVYYDFPLSGHPHAFVVARAARCAADQDRFWEYHDVAFANQEAWSFSQSTPIAQLKQYAATVGLDGARFGACLESDAHAETVTANQMLGEQLGVRGTPTVFVNNRQLVDWQEYGAAKAEILRTAGVQPAA